VVKIRSLFLNRWTQKIHKRKNRGNDISISNDDILRITKELFKRMKRKKHVKESVRQITETIGDMSLRIDLMGAPELSLILDIREGKLNLLKEKKYTHVGIAFHKSFFLNFITNPPEHNQAHVALNNMVLRKGEVRVFQCLGVLFFGSLVEGLCSDFTNARTEMSKLKMR